MLIQRLEIISFGKFKNKCIDLSDGLNIICGDNESGKSTIISFIYAMLFGFGDNRGKELSFREKYTPWSGGTCEGKLLLHTERRNVTIYRKAGNAKKYDHLRIYDTDTGEDIPTTCEELLGINGDTFLKTLCVRQLSTVFDSSNNEIVTRLSNLSGSGDEKSNYDKALKLLESARREIQHQRGNGGSLSKLNEQILIAEKEAIYNEHRRMELESAKALLPDVRKKFKEIEKEYHAAIKADYDSTIAHLTGRLEEKSAHVTSPVSHFFKFFIGAAIVFFVLFCIMLYLKPYYSLPFFIAGIMCVAGNLILKRKGESADSSTDDIASEITALKREKENHDKKTSLLKKQLSSAEEEFNTLSARINSLSMFLKESDHTVLEKLYTQKNLLEKKFDAFSRSITALTTAHEKMQSNFTPQLNKKASQYFSTITENKYVRIFCDEEFGLKIDTDIPRESSYFSGGTVDQLYLSLRLALTDMLFGERKMPLILDQPFLQYDPMRKNNTVALLENMSDKRQTLLFTTDKMGFSPDKKIEMLT